MFGFTFWGISLEVFAARHSEQVDFRFEWIIFFETSGMFDSKKKRNKKYKDRKLVLVFVRYFNRKCFFDAPGLLHFEYWRDFFPKWVLLGVYLSHDVEGNFEKFCHTPKIILTENLIRVWELLGNQVTSTILWSNPFISHPTNWKFTLQRSKNSKRMKVVKPKQTSRTGTPKNKTYAIFLFFGGWSRQESLNIVCSNNIVSGGSHTPSKINMSANTWDMSCRMSGLLNPEVHISIYRTKLKHTHLWMSIIVRCPICSLFLDGFSVWYFVGLEKARPSPRKKKAVKGAIFLEPYACKTGVAFVVPSHEQKMHSCFERRWNFMNMLPAPGSHWLHRHIPWICAISQPNKQSNAELSRTRN